MHVDDHDLTDRASRIEALLVDMESLPDPEVRDQVTEIVRDLLALHGEGLARMLAVVERRCEPATKASMFEDFAADELIAHLLLLHDAHPVDVATRVARALDTVRPYLQSHGGDVELVGVEGGVARVRLRGSCHGCPSSTATLKLAIEEALWKAAPDLEGIEAEGAAEPAARTAAFVPVATLQRMPPCPVPRRTAGAEP